MYQHNLNQINLLHKTQTYAILSNRRRNQMAIPAKARKSFTENIKRFQDLIKRIKRDEANESNTADVIRDLLADMLGYDKYSEVESEYAIKKGQETYCDLVITEKLPNGTKNVQIVIEVKRIGIKLNEKHARQAIDYCYSEGVDWAILTDAEYWQIYKVGNGKPKTHEVIKEFNFLDLKASNEQDLEVLYSISKFGMVKSAISELHAQNQFKNSRLIAELLCRDDVTSVLRRDLRKLFPEIKNKITNEALAEILKRDVIKGVIFDDNTNEEAKEVKKLLRKLNKPTAKKAKPEPTTKEEPQSPASTD